MSEGRVSNGNDGFTANDRAAMEERAAELLTAAKRARGASKAELNDLLDAIAKLPVESDRPLTTRLHELMTAAAPELGSHAWFGTPSADRRGATA